MCEKYDQEKNDPEVFFNPYKQIDKTQNKLPHWQQGDVCVFVTWRLGDSLPQDVVKRWRYQKSQWIQINPKPWNEKTENEYYSLFGTKPEYWSDECRGSCLLKSSECAEILKSVLTNHDGIKYQLISYVIMPNHVHILFKPFELVKLAKIIQTWKRVSARQINRYLNSKGSLWQRDYWDRLIRSQNHFDRVKKYIFENPKKARLKVGEYLYYSMD